MGAWQSTQTAAFSIGRVLIGLILGIAMGGVGAMMRGGGLMAGLAPELDWPRESDLASKPPRKKAS